MISPQESGKGHVRVITEEEMHLRYRIADRIRELTYHHVDVEHPAWQKLVDLAKEIEGGK